MSLHRILIIIALFLLAATALSQTPPDSQTPPGSMSAPDTTKPAVADTVSSMPDTTGPPADSPVVVPLPLVDTVIIIPRLDFSSVRLADALSALARAHNLSLYVDSSVTGLVSLRLDNVTLNDALRFIIKEYDLAWERTGDIVKIFRPEPPPPPPAPLDVRYDDGQLSVQFENADLQRVVDTLVDLTALNIIIERGVSGTVSGKLTDMSVRKFLTTLLPANGYTVSEVDGVFYIGAGAAEQAGGVRTRNLNLTCADGLVTLDAANAGLADVVTALIRECGLSIFVQTALEGTVQASFADKTPDEALSYLLMNSKYSYAEINGIYFVGNRESQDLYSTRLIRLKHLIATNVETLIPANVATGVTIKVAKEHNGLVVTGPSTALTRLAAFIDEIDVPTAQVLFDVLVVDYNINKASEFNITANNFGAAQGLPGQTYFPSIDISSTGEALNDDLESLSHELDISKPFTLSDDFFIRLRWLQSKGIANVRSHPQIAALNGHAASISIGTTQYFLLETKTIYPQSQQDFTQTAQRFETIEADMSLEVIPYVNMEGELIVEVSPEFSMPATQFDPEIPPTINRRVLKSTVRLKDGETIVLGGLVQIEKSRNVSKLPILGSIPILGYLFQNRSTSDVKSELMIYITPHVYYGSEGAVDIEDLLRDYE